MQAICYYKCRSIQSDLRSRFISRDRPDDRRNTVRETRANPHRLFFGFTTEKPALPQRLPAFNSNISTLLDRRSTRSTPCPIAWLRGPNAIYGTKDAGHWSFGVASRGLRFRAPVGPPAFPQFRTAGIFVHRLELRRAGQPAVPKAGHSVAGSWRLGGCGGPRGYSPDGRIPDSRARRTASPRFRTPSFRKMFRTW